MSALICGSLAYDTIMVFPERFKDHIIPDKVHMLNVSFLVPEMRRQFGGVAGNIAYNHKLLGGEPIIMATVGGVQESLKRVDGILADVQVVTTSTKAATVDLVTLRNEVEQSLQQVNTLLVSLQTKWPFAGSSAEVQLP